MIFFSIFFEWFCKFSLLLLVWDGFSPEDWRLFQVVECIWGKLYTDYLLAFDLVVVDFGLGNWVASPISWALRFGCINVIKDFIWEILICPFNKIYRYGGNFQVSSYENSLDVHSLAKKSSYDQSKWDTHYLLWKELRCSTQVQFAIWVESVWLGSRLVKHVTF